MWNNFYLLSRKYKSLLLFPSFSLRLCLSVFVSEVFVGIEIKEREGKEAKVEIDFLRKRGGFIAKVYWAITRKDL